MQVEESRCLFGEVRSWYRDQRVWAAYNLLHDAATAFCLLGGISAMTLMAPEADIRLSQTRRIGKRQMGTLSIPRLPSWATFIGDLA